MRTIAAAFARACLGELCRRYEIGWIANLDRNVLTPFSKIT